MSLASRLPAIAVLACLTGCHGDATGPSESAALSVSDVSFGHTSIGAFSRASLSADEPDAVQGVTYVALPPGTIPGGSAATIRNLTSGTTLSADVVDGGLEPLALPAEAGDSIAVEAVNAAGGPSYMRAVVPARRAPIVIRTNPARRRTDVPLNTRIVAVFGEPIDARTLTSESVELFHGDQPVAGHVIAGPDGLTAEFIPDEPLLPATVYRFVITRTVTDASGDHLESVYEIEFTSGESATPAAGVQIRPANARRQPGTFAYFTAAVVDADGNIIAGPEPTWSSSAETIATLDDAGVRAANLARALRPGTAVISATAAGVTGSATLQVEALRFTSLAVGADYACGTTSANFYCWGRWIFPFGDSSGAPLAAPFGWGAVASRAASNDSTACPLESGSDACSANTCVLVARSPLCWAGHQPARPVTLQSSTRFVEIAAGISHGCGIAIGGDVECWGAYAGTAAGFLTATAGPPIRVPGLSRIIMIAAGANHDCAIDAGDRLWCWGSNNDGQLGRHDRQQLSSPLAAVQVPLPPTIAVAAGMHHTCAVTSSGAAYCWGANDAGQLGTGRVQDETAPSAVAGTQQWRSISAGTHHSCAIDSGGTAYCWGANNSSQLGAGAAAESLVPLPVSTSLRFIAIYAGDQNTCGIATDGIAYCWGSSVTRIPGPGVPPLADPVVSPTPVLDQR